MLEVNETSIAQLRNRLDEVLLEKSDLEYALSFYKNLIEDSAEKGPVEMFEFKAFATEAEDVYVFHFVRAGRSWPNNFGEGSSQLSDPVEMGTL